MKILFTGGVKSGKSRHAEKRVLEMSRGKKPVYLATTELLDPEMKERISEHRRRRGEKFHTLEEPLHLADTLQSSEVPVLVECLTMWLNNAMHYQLSEKKIFAEIENLLLLKCDVIFVLNDGKVQEKGTHDELLLKNGLYKQLWNIQSGNIET